MIFTSIPLLLWGLLFVGVHRGFEELRRRFYSAFMRVDPLGPISWEEVSPTRALLFLSALEHPAYFVGQRKLSWILVLFRIGYQKMS